MSTMLKALTTMSIAILAVFAISGCSSSNTANENSSSSSSTIEAEQVEQEEGTETEADETEPEYDFIIPDIPAETIILKYDRYSHRVSSFYRPAMHNDENNQAYYRVVVRLDDESLTPEQSFLCSTDLIEPGWDDLISFDQGESLYGLEPGVYPVVIDYEFYEDIWKLMETETLETKTIDALIEVIDEG